MDLSVCSLGYCADTYYRSFYVGGGWRALQRVTINPRCAARPRAARRRLVVVGRAFSRVSPALLPRFASLGQAAGAAAANC